jgi:hypothetical protein
MLALTLGGALAGSASADAYSVSVVAAHGGVTVSGSASKEAVLFVLFDPTPCATTLSAEGIRPDIGSWGGIVTGKFKRTYGPGDYQPSIARYVCVYVQTVSANPVTVLRTSTTLD